MNNTTEIQQRFAFAVRKTREVVRTPRRRWRPVVRRRGVETLEAILALPVLVIATVAVLEFGIALLVQQAVVDAAIEGAFEAAKEGSNTSLAAREVRRQLAVHNLTFNTAATNATDDVRVVVENGFLGTTEQRGNITLACFADGSAPDATQVRVTVCVLMTDGNNHPVPNWLAFAGFSLTGRRFEASATAQIE